MDAYDFDHCIYAGDCTIDFFRFCLKKKPKLLHFLPRQIWGLVLYAFGFIQKTAFKERFFCFLQGLDERDTQISSFWETHKKKIYGWYLERQNENDLIISASPEFLLEPLMKRLGLTMIASRVVPETGVYEGLNCHGEEKVRRMREAEPETQIDGFYSDSKSDTPLAKLAQNAFLVTGDELSAFPLN